MPLKSTTKSSWLDCLNSNIILPIQHTGICFKETNLITIETILKIGARDESEGMSLNVGHLNAEI